MRRMDRYKDETIEPKLTRSDQNKELYDSIGTNTRYASFSDVTNANAIDMSSKKNSNTREGYHQMKEYQEVVPTPRVKKELEEFKSLYQDRENKVYDINNVLEEARKNRTEKDELEEKRKLKNSSYNILSNLNKEELEKYRQEKKHKVIHSSDDELRELIDTITSKTLAGDIQAASSLLSDLMATSIMDPVEKPEEIEEEQEATLTDEKLNIEEIKKLADKKEELAHAEDDEVIKIEEKTECKKEENIVKDDSFYTRSMDLSEADFELEEEFKEKKLPLGIKILIFLIIVVIIATVGLFIWKMQ
ncbi:MAG: hypothetical protein J6C28_00320 [Bacilli bacterium]|nr:hypothetical protein [Bacilli bacterium]